MAYRKKLDLDLNQVLTFPEIDYNEAKKFRQLHYISTIDIEKYTGINRRTVQNIDAGYEGNISTMKLYFLAIERLMMLDKGYVPAYRKIGTNEFLEGVAE